MWQHKAILFPVTTSASDIMAAGNLRELEHTFSHRIGRHDITVHVKSKATEECPFEAPERKWQQSSVFWWLINYRSTMQQARSPSAFCSEERHFYPAASRPGLPRQGTTHDQICDGLRGKCELHSLLRTSKSKISGRKGGSQIRNSWQINWISRRGTGNQWSSEAAGILGQALHEYPRWTM